jgi:hypothetical protein
MEPRLIILFDQTGIHHGGHSIQSEQSLACSSINYSTFLMTR